MLSLQVDTGWCDQQRVGVGRTVGPVLVRDVGSMVSMDWSSSLDKDLHDTTQTQSNLRDILQGYGSLQGYGRSQAAHQQRTDGAGQEGDASPAGGQHSAEEAR